MNRLKTLGLVTGLFGLLWLVCLADWMWFFRFAGYRQTLALGERSIEVAYLYWIPFILAAVLSCAWLGWAGFQQRRVFWLIVVGSLCYPALWHFSVFVVDQLAATFAIQDFGALRTYLVRLGTAGFFVLGLLWTIWFIDAKSQKYDARRLQRLLESESNRGNAAALHGGVVVLPPEQQRPIWNPLDINAWYYNFKGTDLISPGIWGKLPRELAGRNADTQTRPQRKLNQSLSGLAGYCLAFTLMFLVLSNIGGCEEFYEMPAGGGEQAQIAQQVKVQKVIKKKFVVNPFSAINFRVPPIDEVKLQLTEITKHAYTIGQGKGTGAGFAGGTNRGKVRFIRLEYTGGDWDQDFGIGADLNMLIEYGIRTQHKVANKTESRTIGQLKNFAKFKSPPYVFMTGQRNISLSKKETGILKEYLLDKHGMLFIDNGGSGHFHNQVIAMMNRVLPGVRPVEVPRDDQIHRIPYPIPRLPYVAPHGGRVALGWKVDGRWVTYYHPGDIGDAWTDDHSGVPPEIWEACYQLGTNVIFYAHAEYSKWLEAQKNN